MSHSRFVNDTSEELQEVNRNPIFGYENSPVLPLNEAVQLITTPISRIAEYVTTALEKCNQYSSLLTRDESAAVYLYTMPIPFFSSLSTVIRERKYDELPSWYAFLQLLVTALKKLPSTEGTIWRGIYTEDAPSYVDDDVHIWWSVNSCSKNPNSVQPYVSNGGILFTIDAVHGKDISQFSAIRDEQEVILLPGTRIRRRNNPLNFDNRLFVLHLEEVNPQNESNYLFEQIKQEYLRNNRLHRIMNPSKAYPINKSYINLAMVTAEDQRDKEKELCDMKHSDAMMGSYEEIYGVKAAIDLEDIFKTCKTERKQALVFGRAGIGKSTFCRYIAYQWARGSLWSKYELLVVIPLRRLTANRYPPSKNYSLVDIVLQEVFTYELFQSEEALFREQFDARKTLWILDGYDEIVQNVPSHLENLLKHLLNTPNHIITSRPYLNTLSYDVRMEITGFTDENIKQYIEQFFNQMKDDLDDVQTKCQTLSHLLDSNRSIWGIAHIPVNLELICSVWSDRDSTETHDFTVTTLYTTVITWLCRRYMISQNQLINMLSEDDIYQYCRKELVFLETLAFRAMTDNRIIIRPSLLKKALQETKLSLKENPNALNFGVLKSFNERKIGTHLELEKDYYFVHLSFQEFFAARHIVNALLDLSHGDVIAFIQNQKYNQRCMLVLSFVAGLLSEHEDQTKADTFWNAILSHTVDLVGVRHMQLIISCLEATPSSSNTNRQHELLKWIAQLIQHHITSSKYNVKSHLAKSLRSAQTVLYNQIVVKVFDLTTQLNSPDTICQILLFLAATETSHPPELLLSSLATSICAQNADVMKTVCTVIAEIGDVTATPEVMNKLLIALEDKEWTIRHRACHALRLLGKKAAEPKVVAKLLDALEDKDEIVRGSACNALEAMGDIIATDKVINKLLIVLTDKSYHIRYSACQTLRTMGKKAATPLVLREVMIAVGDQIESVRSSAHDLLVKIVYEIKASEIINELLSLLANENSTNSKGVGKVLELLGDKVAVPEVISKLMITLGDNHENVRSSSCEALEAMGERAASPEVIRALMITLRDKHENVRSSARKALTEIINKAQASEITTKLLPLFDDKNLVIKEGVCTALVLLGKKAATSEVLGRLVTLLDDENRGIRICAIKALEAMSKEAATSEVINKPLSIFENKNVDIKYRACQAFRAMGERAATPEVISKLMITLGDNRENVRSSACEALEAMGERAATSEVINKLLSILENKNVDIKYRACQAFRAMGERAATPEVISKLMITLGDDHEYVRSGSCEALEAMGERAATSAVISTLMITLSDKHENVRSSARKALREIINKAQASEIITKLLPLFDDENRVIKEGVCTALVLLGKKAATSEVLGRLVTLLDDENRDIMICAINAPEAMSKEAATSEVINKPLSILENKNGDIKYRACQAFRAMGERAATPEVISMLMITLGDNRENVRSSACEALEAMGERAATSEVINKLLSILENKNVDIKYRACQAFRAMGERAATPEVISKLMITLGDDHEYVRSGSCEALEAMGEKAATPEVIDKLMNISVDEQYYSRYSARAALVAMGIQVQEGEIIRKPLTTSENENLVIKSSACTNFESRSKKAETTERISTLLPLLAKDEWFDLERIRASLKETAKNGESAGVINKFVTAVCRKNDCEAIKVLRDMFNMPYVLKNLDAKVLADVYNCEDHRVCLEEIAINQLLNMYQTTASLALLPLITENAVREGIAITIVNDTAIVYSAKEPIELRIPEEKSRNDLNQALEDLSKHLGLRFP